MREKEIFLMSSSIILKSMVSPINVKIRKLKKLLVSYYAREKAKKNEE